MDAQITQMETRTSTLLVGAVRRALNRAVEGESRIDPEVLGIGGFSGRKYRMFINNLIASLPDARYLEVGSWAGSTLCAAISGNAVEALAIDNWSQFEGPAATFLQHLARFKGKARVSFLERDFRAVNYGAVGKFNVYLFDGPHEFRDQYDGVMLAQPALDDSHVLVVDDWNWPQVRAATKKGFADADLRVDFLAEIRTSLDDQHAPPPAGGESDWHNGYMIAVLSKPLRG
jgi:hypothetical protein